MPFGATGSQLANDFGESHKDVIALNHAESERV